MKKTEAVGAPGKISVPVGLAMAAGGMALGLLLMLSGLILWVISAVERQNHDRWESILIVASFVFFGIGAHGLDLVNKAEKAEKRRKLDG